MNHKGRCSGSEIGSRGIVPVGIATVIPTYNPGSYLAETVASVARQVIRPSEVIIVDDGSDNRVSLPRTPLPVKLIRIPHSGISAARNAGIRAAKSSLIHICDHDDIIEPLFYQNVVAHFVQRPTLDVVHAECGFIDDLGSVLGGRLPGSRPAYDSMEATLSTLLRGNPIASVAAVFRRCLFEELDGFQKYDFVQDWSFWLRAAQRGSSFGFLPGVFAWHRLHPGQQSSAAGSNHVLAESIQMLTSLSVPARHRRTRGRTVADLRLELIRVSRNNPDNISTWGQAMRALCWRPRGAVKALFELKG